MEILILIVSLAGLELAAWRFGVDSRPGIDDEPHRQI